MNDITSLALLVSKAKASAFTMEYISQFEASDIDSDDVDLRFEVDGVETGTNVSIVDECGQAAQIITALAEALEKAQRWERRWHQVATRVHEQACDSDVKIEELEQLLSDGVTEEALVLRERIAELESRTVTVKLPSLKQTESCERYVWSDGVFNYRSDVIGILRAAGIQVIEGEA